MSKALTELIRDANRSITPADRHAILDLIEQQAAKITELSLDLERTREERNRSQIEARREIHKEHRDYIAKLEAQLAAVAPAVDAQPVAYAAQFDLDVLTNSQESHKMRLRRRSHGSRTVPLYTSAQSEGFRKDALRYRWLRDTLHGAKAGGGVEVNDALQVYERPTPGEEVRIYWYQDTPVGFYEAHGTTLDEAIDEGMADKDPQ